ncbi:MAG: Threonylcarbamoyladenosine tRNA methylthiotransferase MtaB [Candidatus Omnitrophica bacterium ADurb.Bin277]|nr:MAG: Threonylcarbamoyladenosine tRNA methylthiotransferase MtaB [Candidatus Omnitrophica bacterium ADurb.Bin277]
MDLVIVNLPPWSQENPHIGIGYLASYLRAKKISLKLFDLNKSFFNDHPELQALWHVENKNYWSNEKTFPAIVAALRNDIDKAVDEIVDCEAGILGFSVVDPKERLTIEFIKSIKKKAPRKRIILGGPATSTREQRHIFLEKAAEYVDFFVIGEGEETLFDLTDRLLNGKSLSGLKGCYFKNNGTWEYQERPPIQHLESLPFPTYEEFNMSLYSDALLVEWSRGCRSRCAFCKNHKLFPYYRSKSPDWALRELKYHCENKKIHEFTVVDNVLNGDPPTLEKICDKILSENLRLRWSGQIAPREEMTFEFFKKMREAGCYKLQIGLESGSNKILKIMRKPFTAETSEQNIRNAKRAGIETEIFVMIGFPGESEEDFRETCHFVKKNADVIDAIKSINTLHLIAGTDVYDHAAAFGLKSLPEKDWYYLWETKDGNTYPVRKRRAERLLQIADGSNIRVLETNISEGKERRLDLLCCINREEPGNAGLTVCAASKAYPVKMRRNIKKWTALIFLSVFVLVYTGYFWLFAMARGRVLLGGKKRAK